MRLFLCLKSIQFFVVTCYFKQIYVCEEPSAERFLHALLFSKYVNGKITFKPGCKICSKIFSKKKLRIRVIKAPTSKLGMCLLKI